MQRRSEVNSLNKHHNNQAVVDYLELSQQLQEVAYLVALQVQPSPPRVFLEARRKPRNPLLVAYLANLKLKRKEVGSLEAKLNNSSHRHKA